MSSVATEYETLNIIQQDGVLIVELNNPPMNVITIEVGRDLKALCEELSQTDSTSDIRVVLFRSANRGIFCAGADITMMAQAKGPEGEQLLQKLAEVGNVFDSIESIPMPTVVGLEGIALGGGFELALACDFRIAADDLAQVGLPEVRLGLLPGGGGTQRLTRLVGTGVATEMIMKGMRYDAQTALDKGLVHKIVPADSFVEEIERYAKSLSYQAPRALRHIKQLIRASFVDSGVNGLELERELFRDLLTTNDAEEGITAAIENRRAAFEGK